MAAAAKKKAESEEVAGGPFVSAPLVSVTTQGGTVKHLYRGDVVTDEVSEESLENLRSLGFVSDERP